MLIDRRDAGKVALALLIWLVAVVCVSVSELLPGDSSAMVWVGSMRISDKLLHFGAYTLLSLIAFVGLPAATGIRLAAITVLLGIALEFTQRLVPGRSFDTADMLANTIGVIAGGILGGAVGWLGARRRKRPVETKTRG